MTGAATPGHRCFPAGILCLCMKTIYKHQSKDKLHIVFAIVTRQDFESLVALRIAAMRESLERVGRFDRVQAKERLKNSVKADCARHILVDGVHAGFFVVKPLEQTFLVEHLYIHPDYQGRGIGAIVMQSIIEQAQALKLPITVKALKESRSNSFYQYHGFVAVEQDEWNIYYRRPAKSES